MADKYKVLIANDENSSTDAARIKYKDMGDGTFAEVVYFAGGGGGGGGPGVDQNYVSDDELEKLRGIETEATKNDTDENLRDRSTHTGFQPASTISDLPDILSSKVDVIAGKQLSDMNYTEAEKTKLANLEDRSNHTGVQAASTISDLPDILAGKVDVVAGKQLSDMNYTEAEKTKLASLEDAHFKGVHVGLAGLQAAHPSGAAGDYAVVDDTVNLTWYQWDATGSEWVARVGESTELTPAQIKSYYEGNPDTNAFTDDQKTALNSFMANGVSWADVKSKPSTFAPTIGTTSTTAKAGNYQPTWAQVTSKPDFDALYAKKGRGGISAPIQAAYVWSDAAVSVPSSTNTAWPINSKTYDYFTMLSGNELIIPSWANRIRVTGGFFFDENPNGYRYVGILRNTTTLTGIRAQAVTGSSTTVNVNTPLWPVTAGDKITVNLFQTSGATLNVAVASWVNVELFEDN